LVLNGGLRRLVAASLILSLTGAFLVAASALDWRAFGARHVLLLAAGMLGVLAIAALVQGQARLYARLERLRGHIALAAADTPLPPVRSDSPDSIDRLHLAVADLIGRRRIAQAELDHRLEQLMGALPDPVLAVTPEGLVSLVNAAARAMLGEPQSMVGTSVYDVLGRGELAAAMASARENRQPVECRLETLGGRMLSASVSAFPDAGGAVIRFAPDQDSRAPEPEGLLEHDLALHDRPPAIRITADTLLGELPGLVLDTETTGLNPERDRIVSFGAVRLHGSRLLRAQTIDLLINPGRQIPATATSVHGISDLMVLPAPAFRDIAPKIMRALSGVAAIGHHTAFDLTILRRAARDAGLPWQDPPWLDTALLYSALHPEARHFDLDWVAGEVGLSVHGRHTALGDALATAEIYLRLLPQLEARGIRTLGQAIAFQLAGRKLAGGHSMEEASALPGAVSP
jgi:DNA polymerase-3 subunit epsilon